MIFTGPPNLLIRVTKSKNLRPLPKTLRFDNNGHCEVNDPRLIKKMINRFEKAYEYKCKECDFSTFHKTELMRHYKTHKEIANEQ